MGRVSEAGRAVAGFAFGTGAGLETGFASVSGFVFRVESGPACCALLRDIGPENSSKKKPILRKMSGTGHGTGSLAR
ncbi:hypothetical protein D3C87_1566660 [compost metagenome]